MELEQLEQKISEYIKERTLLLEKLSQFELLLMGSDDDIDAFIDTKLAALGPMAAMVKPMIKPAKDKFLPDLREVAGSAKRLDGKSVELVGFIVDQVQQRGEIANG